MEEEFLKRMGIDLGGRNPEFVCGGCLGDLIVTGEREGRKDYNCAKCGKNPLRECVICHLPKSIWADDGDICAACALKAYKGEIRLTDQQIVGLIKWRVSF